MSSLPDARQLHIRGRFNGWYNVYYSGTNNLMNGWVSSDHVYRPAVSTMWVFRVTGSSVNYRTGPGTNYAAVATLSQGSIVPRAGSSLVINGFNNVVFRGLGNGWMSRDFLVSAS